MTGNSIISSLFGQQDISELHCLTQRENMHWGFVIFCLQFIIYINHQRLNVPYLSKWKMPRTFFFIRYAFLFINIITVTVLQYSIVLIFSTLTVMFLSAEVDVWIYNIELILNDNIFSLIKITPSSFFLHWRVYVRKGRGEGGIKLLYILIDQCIFI